MVVVAITSVLASLLLPVLTRGNNRARRTACLSNLRQIGVAAALYCHDYSGRMPWVDDADLQLTPPVNSSGKRYASMGSFMPMFFPYLGRAEVFVCPPVLGEAGFQEIDIMGGEPMLVPWMKDFIRRVTALEMTVNISTNGSLPEKLQEFADMPPDSMNVGFSLHGFSDIHNAITVSDNFSRVVQGIEIMIHAGRNLL